LGNITKNGTKHVFVYKEGLKMVFSNVGEVYEFYKSKAIKECNKVRSLRVLKTDCHNESGIFGHSRPIIPWIKDIVQVDALEIDQDVIDKAKANIGEEGWNVTQGDIRKLPYSDDSFDLLLDFSTIDHVEPEELPLVIKEYHRVCKPHGKFTIIVWLSNHNEQDSAYSYQYYFEKEYFKEELEKLGVIVESYHLLSQGSNFERQLWGFDGEWRGNT
jgi:SAM-dependent methyltransferase